MRPIGDNDDAGHMIQMATMPIYGDPLVKDLLWNRLTDQSQISYEASFGKGKKIYLHKWSRSHYQDGRHTQYMVQTFKIFLSRTRSPMILKLDMQHQGLELSKVYINDDPGLIFP